MDDSVSAIIPCRDGAADLAGAVDSLRRQQVPGLEIVIVDDASRDDSAAVAAALAAGDPAIRLIRLPQNRGPAAARNAGLRAARGTLVCFLDVDDRYAPRALARLRPALAARPRDAGIVMGVALVDCPVPVHPLQLDAVVASLPGNLLARRAAVEAVGGFPEDPAFRGPAAGEDLAFRRALARWFGLGYAPEPLYRHRARPGGHLLRFLERSRVADGRLVVDSGAEGAALAAALARHAAEVERILGNPAGLRADPGRGEESR
ncbi:MAG: glycosyltransferase family A protein [Dongiaceae bacterium]